MPLPPRNEPALPFPTAEETAVSSELTALIREEIRRAGSIGFSRYMELALYAPGVGYYMVGKEKLGASGDFTTAPESFPLFGRCLAVTAREVLEQLGDGDVLEVGAGSGKLAVELLRELDRAGTPPRRYYILDVSPHLRARQAQTLREAVPSLCDRVQWLDRLPATFSGLVLGNELLDAIPVERFQVGPDAVRQLRVDWKDDGFAWTDAPAGAPLTERVAPSRLAPGYASEVGFAAEAWTRSVADILQSGMVLLVDYGFPRAEFYHPDRSGGTLMCHYRHRTHADPLILTGLQDITAHVDFTAIAEAGADAGLDVLGYTSQAAFLIGSGLEHVAGRLDPSDVRAHLALTDQIKKLTLPHEMGELYKVLALGRGLQRPLKAFSLQDRRHRL
jgi:SAM-dependent MidA family methyltransferase